MSKTTSTPMFAGKLKVTSCINCGEDFKMGQAVYMSGLTKKPYCSDDCLGQHTRDTLRPTIDECEREVIEKRQFYGGKIAMLEFVISQKGNPMVSFNTFNSSRHNQKADCEDPTEQLMFLKLKTQIFGSKLLMLRNIRARNAVAYNTFKTKFQEQYEEYIAKTKNDAQRTTECDASMDWLKMCGILEDHFLKM